MPLTAFQTEVLTVIANNRRPESHLAGGVVLNRDPASPRYSDDLDVFHDPEDSVAQSAEADAACLVAASYAVRWDVERCGPTFRRAIVSKGRFAIRLEWVVDSPFRFFPVQSDATFGYCLHLADIATNKLLAMADRREVRDYLHVLHLDATYLYSGGAGLGRVCQVTSRHAA